MKKMKVKWKHLEHGKLVTIFADHGLVTQCTARHILSYILLKGFKGQVTGVDMRPLKYLSGAVLHCPKHLREHSTGNWFPYIF